jgi:hypothetical protein
VTPPLRSFDGRATKSKAKGQPERGGFAT